MKYRKKPVVIDAIQWTGDNLRECMDFLGGDYQGHDLGHPTERDWFAPVVYVKTLEGSLSATKWDYLIKGIKGEHYPCKPDVFKETYEELEG